MNRLQVLVALGACLADLLVAGGLARADTLYVPQGGSVQGAINSAENGDEVVVSPGQYYERINFNGKAITLRSTDPNDPSVIAATIIDGYRSGAVVTFNHGEAAGSVLAGFTIRNGYTFAIPGGGGVCCNGTSPIIRRNIVVNCVAVDNGVGNGHGGGICCWGAGSPTIEGNTVRAGHGGYGGGIYCGSTSAIVRSNVVTASHAIYGAGIMCETTSVTLENNVVGGNDGMFGGALYCISASVTARNNTFCNNRATGRGGGIYARLGALTLSNNIIAFASTGGGVWISDCTAATSYCDVYGNTGGDYIGISDPTGTSGNISDDPLFADPAASDFHLRSTGGHYTPSGWMRDPVSSPCIDTGDPVSEFSNEPAPNGGRINMGFEGNTAEASKQPNRAPGPVASLVLSPGSPVCTSTLVARAGGAADPDGDALGYQYQWSLWSDDWGTWAHDSTDGALIEAVLAKGDRWRVRARADDGALQGPWCDPVETSIQNTIPSVPGFLSIAPTAPNCCSEPVATAGGSSDADTSDTIAYKYQWAMGLEPWGHDSTNGILTGVTLVKGDTWAVRACATDGTADSAWTDPVEVTIRNTAPTAPDAVVLTPASPTSVRDLRLAVTGGADADGDSLRYACQYSHRTAGEEWSLWQPCGRIISHTLTTRGEEWRVRVRTSDGTAASHWLVSNTVTIRNAPPPRPDAVTISPVHPHPHEELTAVATGGPDPNGDSITYVYRWRRSLDGGAHWSRWSWRGQTLSKLLVAPGSQWQAEARASDGMEEGPWRVSVPVTADGGAPPQRGAALPAVTVAAAPTGGGVQIVTTLYDPATVQAIICNLAGRPVAVLPERPLDRGTHTLLWDGRSTAGTKVPPGPYLVRVTARTEDGQQSAALAAVRLQ